MNPGDSLRGGTTVTSISIGREEEGMEIGQIQHLSNVVCFGKSLIQSKEK